MEVLIIDKDAEFYASEIRKAHPDVRVHAAASADAAPPEALQSQLLVGLAPYLPATLIARMPRLAWVHALTTGVDNLLAPGVLPQGVALSRTRGVHGPQMAELAILMMLALLRDLRGMQAEMGAGQWTRRPQPMAAGRTMCIIGLGGIAEALARRANALDMRVIGVSNGRSAAEGFARIHPRSEITQAAAETDVMVVIVPHSPETHHIVDASVIAAMKPGGLVINIARGGCLDEAALVAALDAGHLAGAGLDVFEQEPLPADHPLRGRSDVILTPHIGGMSATYAQQAAPILLDHLRAYLAGGATALPDPVARAEEVQ